MVAFREAINITAKATGRIKPFKAPAAINNNTGLPNIKKITVERRMNADMIHLSFLKIKPDKVFKKETEVNDAPMTDVIAAHHMTSPKKRKPMSPAALLNTLPAGLPAFS